jgi:adenylate kinase
MKDIILIGKQGSGKGTQGKILAEKFGFVIFETGAELRQIASRDSELGQEVKAIVEQGDLVSNEIVMRIVAHFISDIPKGKAVIFDGIPRSKIQRVSLEEELEKAEREFVALEVRLSEEEAFTRLSKRADIEGRADDNPESIRKRLANFAEHTAPLLKIWRSEGKLVSVDGEQNIEAVTAEMLKALELE